jgi:tRNA(fMet)-specific endonuclease VapC
MRYLFDTNIVLGYIRRNHIANTVNQILELTDENEIFISIVSIGELLSIATQNNWGTSRRNDLGKLLSEYQYVYINDDPTLNRYAMIDAFSQDKLTGRPLNTSARNMGKNDLWIAATASVIGATLITTDKDFDHLHQQFVEVIWLDPKTV